MDSFKDLSLPDRLQQALEKINFIEMTPIQKKALPILMGNDDLIACSETGSGKTGAYAIPMIAKLMENPEATGLILAPTRELAQQIATFVDELSPDKSKFSITILVGGADIRKQFKALQRKPRVIVATPGRLIDHLKRNTVQIHKTEILVLDEGDRMIDMGFAPQLKQILSYLPEKRQTSFFTATLDEAVRKLSAQYLKNPQKVVIGEASRPVSSIKQAVRQVELKDKDECVLDELNTRQGSVIIFLKTQHRTDRLAKYLDQYGVSVDLIHGGRTQGQRNKAIQNFKLGKTRVLCATDIAARGLDVPHVEHVINFDLPMVDEDYVHRIGRTARNGALGEALSFVSSSESRAWNRLAKKFQIKNLLLPEFKGSGGGKTMRKDVFSKRGRGQDDSRPRFKDKDSFGQRPRFKDKDSSSSFSRKPKSEDSDFYSGKSKSDSYSDKPRFKDKDSFGDKPRFKSKDSFSDRPRFNKDSSSSFSRRAKNEDSDFYSGKAKSDSYADKPRFKDKDFGDKPRFKGKDFGDKAKFKSKDSFGDKPRFKDKDSSSSFSKRAKNDDSDFYSGKSKSDSYSDKPRSKEFKKGTDQGFFSRKSGSTRKEGSSSFKRRDNDESSSGERSFKKPERSFKKKSYNSDSGSERQYAGQEGEKPRYKTEKKAGGFKKASGFKKKSSNFKKRRSS